MVALAAFHGELDHRFDALIPLIVVKGDDFRIAIHPQGELRQIVGAYGETVEIAGEGVDLDDVVRDLAHDVDLELVLSPHQTEIGHLFNHLLGFHDPATKWDHQLDVGQPHGFAHPPHRRALQGEPFGISGVRITRRPAESEHGVLFGRLEPAPALQRRVLVSLEVRHPHDNRLRIEGRRNRPHPFRQAFNKEVRGSLVSPTSLFDGGALGWIGDLFRMNKGHGMHLDGFADDELHACEPDAVVRQEACFEGKVGVAQVYHDPGRRAR